ncbi:Holliday junction recognition protein isoform X2 [Hyaena hyaena]|uniref:Holliday junction recognition protein isoform X2 n=1 Tax=Hyaena hyaena TaxID=95912 RepID=UPI001920F0A3|nr:Holliday junction recognition protein isoform X2 [Hyaena hyaena]
MEGEPLAEDALLWQLRDSRRRFQTRMQRLIEKYNQPFEDAPLVRMSTLTYETPQGLRIWGGGLVKKKNKEQIQDSLVKTFEDTRVSRSSDDPTEAEAQDSKSSDAASLCEEDVVAGAFMPAVPWSPLKNELRRKYLTQVDTLLRDEGCLECADDGDGEDTRVTPTPPQASPARPAPGRRGSMSRESPGGPVWPASRPCSAALALVPRGDGLSLQGPGGHSFSSSLSFEPDDICDVTISDLYAGMLHSMSRLLSTKPSCVISTKTSFVVHSWPSRSRRSRSRMNRTRGPGGRHCPRGSRERPPVPAEPPKEAEVLRDCENILDASGQKTGVKLEKAFLEVSKPRVLKRDPGWKEFKGFRSLTPQRPSSLTYGDSSPGCHLDPKNRYKALKWLISPVKIVSRSRILPGKGANYYREIEIKFDKLHREYCPSPRKQPFLTSLPGSLAVDVYRGGPASPRGPRGLETRRLSGTFGTAEAKRLNEAFEELGEGAMGAGRCLQKWGPPPSLSETSPVRSPGRSERTLLLQGNKLGILSKSISPSKTTSAAGVQPLSCDRDRYKEIKEQFDKLHQKYCHKSPPRTKALLRIRAPPDKASVEVQYQKGTVGKLNPDPGFRGPPRLLASPPRSIERPLHVTTTAAQPLTCFVLTAGRGHQSPPKRRRLSDSVLCGPWAGSQDSPREVGQPVPRPGERPAPYSPAEKRRKEHIFQDGREK